jgi:DNA-binding GntR family transcriptional regulator
VSVNRLGPVPLYQQIAAELREGIANGSYPPGRRLPSEAELVRKHGVARMTVRSAVRLLVAEGLAEVVAGRGVYVANGAA